MSAAERYCRIDDAGESIPAPVIPFRAVRRCVGAFGRPCLLLTDRVQCDRCWAIVDASGIGRPGAPRMFLRLTRRGADAARDQSIAKGDRP